ncbi:MAG: hypothetical protein JRE62_06365 [Deltaproteobacteria bacterium]|jgi:hypothetical protein|nr:hypothetical protein [Deltaproteobacteria bacterium]
MKMKSRTSNCILVFFCVVAFAGCATYNARKVGPTPIEQAKTEIPEEQLLDVGILVFETKEVTPETAEKEGTNADIRKAETHFIPYHLKNTLHQSSHWGAIQVVPAETNSVDLMVKGKILESNGEHLVLEIDVIDASQKRWFKKAYSANASEATYSGNTRGEKDAYQDIYNAIANDMARYKMKLTAAQIKNIRTIAKLKFAREFAPDAFDGYLKADEKNHLSVNRLPAKNDPMMERLLQIREREYMYVDTLNHQYEGFYAEMWPAYENWRQLNLTERAAIKKIRREAMTKQLIGALLIAGAIAAGSQDSNIGRTMAPAMVIIGGQVFISGWNVSKETQMHKAAIEELSDSFGAEMQPVTMEFEGQQYELTGSAEEQFKNWKKLLHQIYFAETGFEQTPPPDQSETKQDQDL